jgi:hypothetical protein
MYRQLIYFAVVTSCLMLLQLHAIMATCILLLAYVLHNVVLDVTLYIILLD